MQWHTVFRDPYPSTVKKHWRKKRGALFNYAKLYKFGEFQTEGKDALTFLPLTS
jgi:hypothetical protein